MSNEERTYMTTVVMKIAKQPISLLGNQGALSHWVHLLRHEGSVLSPIMNIVWAADPQETTEV